MCEFLTSLAGDFAHILENGDDHNVLINKGEDLIKLLIASDELLLNELQEHIQEYLLKNRSSWLQQNFAIVHKTVFQLESSKDLQEFCLITIYLYEDLKRYHFQTGMQLKPEYLLTPRYKAGNCSCNKESYEQSVGDMFHRESWDSWNGKNGTFAVEDYEVFQVIKLRL
ncbi:7612_t:CDS:2, partial [Gigaspora margarita]